MRTIAWVAAALAVAFTTSCGDRDRRDTGTTAEDRVEAAGERVEAAGEEASGEVREGAARTEERAEEDVETATEDAADKAEEAGKDVGDAVEDAADEVGISSYAYDRRDEFRKDVNERLAAMDKELADLRQGVNRNAAESYTQAVAAAEETRKAAGRSVGRLEGATAATWDELQRDVRTSLDSLGRQLRALRPDATPLTPGSRP
jgi:hypothetical protein